MKKTVLFVLLLTAALAASAQTPDQVQTYEPKWGLQYDCDYWSYSGPATHPGWSNWTIRVRSNPSLIWAIENFQVPYLSGHDNHAVAWAKPQRARYYTIWEFTDGTVQCKSTIVSWDRDSIDFYSCSDGHSRSCHIH